MSNIDYQNGFAAGMATNGIISTSSGEIVEQIQADWLQTDETQPDFIKNKPEIPEIPEIPEFEQVQVDWNQTDETQPDFIKNKPEIPEIPEIPEFEQIQGDWNQTDENQPDFIKNKPEIPEYVEQVQSDYNENDSTAKSYIQNRPFYETTNIVNFDDIIYDTTNGDTLASYSDKSSYWYSDNITLDEDIKSILIEGGTLTAALETYASTGNTSDPDSKYSNLTRTGTLTAASVNDETVLYIGNLYYYTKDSSHNDSKDHLVLFNLDSNKLILSIKSKATRDDGYQVSSCSGCDDVKLSLSYEAEESVIHKIDEKFLPNVVNEATTLYVDSAVDSAVESHKAEVETKLSELSISPDWNENDSESKNYIQNRPFYKEQAIAPPYAIKTGIHLSISEKGYGSLDESIESILEANIGNTLRFTIKDADGNIKDQYSDLIKVSELVSSPDLNIAYAGNRVFITSMKADSSVEENMNYCIHTNQVVIVTGYSFTSGMIDVTFLKAPYYGDNFTLDIEMMSGIETIYHTIDTKFINTSNGITENSTSEEIATAKDVYDLVTENSNDCPITTIQVEGQEVLVEIEQTGNTPVSIENNLQLIADQYYAIKYTLEDGSTRIREKRAKTLSDFSDDTANSDIIITLADYCGPDDENNIGVDLVLLTNCSGYTLDSGDTLTGDNWYASFTESEGNITYRLSGTYDGLNIQSAEIIGATLVDKIAPKWINSSTEITENSTDDEVATAKSVYDLVQNAIQEALYVEESDTV